MCLLNNGTMELTSVNLVVHPYLANHARLTIDYTQQLEIYGDRTFLSLR